MLKVHTYKLKQCPVCARSESSAAFSLVETALAMLVMALGMLTVLALFPAGLDQCKRFMGDTHAGLFAQEVFSALRAQSETNWDNMGADFAWAAADSWDNPGTISNNATNIVINKYSFNGSMNHILRYQLRTDLVRTNSIKSASLSVWSEEFGNTNTFKVFYMEFFKNKP